MKLFNIKLRHQQVGWSVTLKTQTLTFRKSFVDEPDLNKQMYLRNIAGKCYTTKC